MLSVIKQEEIEVLISNSSKPRALSNIAYPLNSLDDRVFEVLTYSIFKKRINETNSLIGKKYDDVVLMQGVGEKGIDCYLKKGDKIAGVIQCKKFSRNISDEIILNDLVKFCLHVINDSSKFDLSKKFKYYVATTTGFTGKANILYASINNKILKNKYDFEIITNKIIVKFKALSKLDYSTIENDLFKLIKSFEYELIGPNDYNLWINDYKDIVETFFEAKKVTDNTLLNQKSEEILERLNNLGKDAFDPIKFYANYTKIAIEKLNVVNFIGFDIQKHRQRPEDIALTDLFVQPSFRQRIKEKNEKALSVIDKDLKITNFFKSEKNIVILGDPGAGKSLLVKFIIVSLLRNQSESLGLRQFKEYFPFRIELRKYNEKRETHNLTDYLSENLTNEYQTKISAINLEGIFEKIPTLIFLDGLDEIFNITHKLKVKESIEAFSTRYPLSKCVVTSRFIGYHDIKFNGKKFDEFSIIPFNPNQIKDLVTKFYHSQHSSQEKRKNAIDSCLRQINEDVDEELKSNPLILTLILILASNNIVIPDSKLEIYESCTKTLVDSIDTNEKDLKIEIPVLNKNFTFCNLAHWQYVAQSRDEEINYDLAKAEIAKFLISRNECNDYKDAELKAEKFLDYAERRSIYFENNFTHKTFLEYFTAEYLYSVCIAKASDNGRKRLLSTVSEFLPSSFWYIVFELLLTRIDNFQPDNELLDEVFNSQLKSNSLDVFYFLITNLAQFKNVSKEVKKKVIERTVMLCIKGEKINIQLKNSGMFRENSIVHKITLLQNDNVLFELLQDVFNDLEYDELSDKQLIELYNLYYEIVFPGFHKETLNVIKITNITQIESLAEKDLLLYSHIYVAGKKAKKSISVNVLVSQIELFGHKSLFTNIAFRHIPYSRIIATFDIYLMNVIENTDYDKLNSDLLVLQNHGLQISYILEHVKKNNIYYYVRSENLEKILQLFIKSSNEIIDQILISLVSKFDDKMQLAYQKIKSKNSSSKLKIFDKVFKIK